MSIDQNKGIDNNPNEELIKAYKRRISKTQLKDEIYKWELLEEYKGRPNTEASDFYNEIKGVEFKNLIYAMAQAVVYQLAKEKQEELRQLFVNLFNDEVNLTDRVKSFNSETLKLYRSLGETLQHHQDERSIATYLTFHNPERYTFYKYSFYKSYCKLLGIKTAKKNEKYTHYLELIDSLVENYIKKDSELIKLVKELLPYKDGKFNYRLLAQDILFQMLDKKQETHYWIFQGNPDIFDFKTALKNDVITDWTVSAHKDKIQVGDKVILWITGKKSGCYGLAEVTSEPHLKGKSTDDHLWKKEDKSDLKAAIKITHNLIDTPILSTVIEYIEELNDLKVGNQGTNFSATEEQYNILLDLISSNEDNIYQKVKNNLDPKLINHYLTFLRDFLLENGISPIDERVSFNVRPNHNRLVFIIGNRYTFSIQKSKGKTYISFISKEATSKDSGTFTNKNNEHEGYWNTVTSITDYEEMIKEGLQTELSRNYNSPHKRYENKDFVQDLYQTNIIMAENETFESPSLNTILYGPPGTGKTYNTVLRAAEIVENRTIHSYDEALSIFRKNLHNQIEFITFHQNYSYEDFIQGLRPDIKDETEQLRFKKSDGIFKIIADRAFANYKESEKAPEDISQVNAFSEALETLKDIILESEQPIRINETAYFTAVEDDAFRYSADNWTLNDKGFNGFRMKYSDLEQFFEEDVKQRKEIKNLKNISGLAKQHATYFIKAFELVKTLMPEKTKKIESKPKKNYVIIIDEINRANISRVFGELITLIEPDKRSHGKIPMEAKLPSGDTFVVPSNLYIIGTMNTADKSIALLDIALRRRFEFEPMYPKYEIDGEEIYDVEILKKINEQIIKTKGHDFQIGHSYFMGENKVLVQRMNKKVIPLLLEYYMNDKNEVEKILKTAGLNVEENSWPLRITSLND